jgi:hypothetical protein
LKRAQKRRATLGDVVQQAGQAVSTASDIVSSVADIARDPYGQELVCRIRQVIGVETGTSIPKCASTDLRIASPAGLRKPVVAMRGYVWAETHKPWSYPAMVAVAIGVPFLLGYWMGKP